MPSALLWAYLAEKYFYNRGKYKEISQKNLTNAYANLLFTLLNNNKIQMKKLKGENRKLFIKLIFFSCIAVLLLIGLLNFSKSNSDLFKGILTCSGSLLTMIIGNSLDTWYHRFSEGNDIESINSEISKKIVEELKYEYTNNQLNTENERSFENLLFDKKNAAFFFIGWAMTALFSVNTVGAAVVGTAIAYTIYQYTISNKNHNNSVDMISDDLGGEL